MALFDTEHQTVPLGKNHFIHDAEYANAAARLAVNTFTNADIGKSYRDLDTGLFFLLTGQTAGVGTFSQLTGNSIPVVQQIKHNFSFGDVPTSLIVSILAGTIITKVEVDVLVAFDGIPSLTVGDVGNTSRLLTADDVDLTQTGKYETNPVFKYSSALDINLYLTAGGALVGNGVLILYYSL
jgi:hypothetical protein